MRTAYFSLSFCVACVVFISSTMGQEPAGSGKQVPAATAVKVTSDGAEREVALRYLLYLPADYEAKGTATWPLVLFLHGSGERGDDLERVKIHGPPKLVSQGKQFPFVLVSPQCPAGSRWNAQELSALVDHLANAHRIDRERLYVTGLSMGGSGTWSLVSNYPGKFAAAMPLCGRGDLAAADKLAKTPTWVLVGDRDRAETVQNCKDMAQALEKAGGEVKLTVYPDLPHDCWTVTYENADVYEWLLSHRLPSRR